MLNCHVILITSTPQSRVPAQAICAARWDIQIKPDGSQILNPLVYTCKMGRPHGLHAVGHCTAIMPAAYAMYCCDCLSGE